MAEFRSLADILASDTLALERIGLSTKAIRLMRIMHETMCRSLRSAMQDKPLLGNWKAVMDYLRLNYGHNSRERVCCLILDGKNRLICEVLVAEGTINSAPAHIREIVQKVLEYGATATILVHNHPSGDPKPSRDDIALTSNLQDILRVLGVGFHDHIIVARGQFSSFKSLGLM